MLFYSYVIIIILSGIYVLVLCEDITLTLIVSELFPDKLSSLSLSLLVILFHLAY